MQDQHKTSDPVLDGIDALRARVDDLAASVTRHRQLEEALQESEELHRITLGSISDAVFITDDEGDFTFICPNVDVIFGYSYDEVQAFGNIAHLLGEEFYVPAELDAVGEIRNIEGQIKDASSQIHTLLVNVKRVAIKGGTVLYTCRDITERKVMEDALREHEQKLQEAQRVAGMGWWDWDILRNEVYWSEEVYRIFGLTPEAFGATYDAFLRTVHPDDREFVQRRVDAALHNNLEYSIDHRVVLPNGESRYVHAQAKVTCDVHSTPVRMMGTVIDITARAQMEEALRHSEARMRSIVDTAGDGIITMNEDGIVESFNAAAMDIFGYTADEVIGQNVTILMPPPYTHEHDKYLARYWQTGERKIIGIGREVVGLRKDGTTFPMDLAVGECSIAGQRIFTGIVRDITERKQLVERLQNALAKVLSGYLPICAQCKKIRDQANNWVQVESYVRDRTEAEFTHSICPSCAQELYPDMFR